ncbi:MAG: AbgT family transporter [Fusobacteriaceae bacterium]
MFLDYVERTGNKLPHPTTLFAILCGLIALTSLVLAYFNVNVQFDAINRATGEIEKDQLITIKSLMTVSGLQWILKSAIKNFTGFAPLGTVLVCGFGIGIAEFSGLITASLKKIVVSTPKQLLTATVVFAGIMSNIASDVGYVVIVPLGAIVFMSFKRHPLAGLAAAFAGVSGGFSANLLVGTLDPLLGGITQEATKIITNGITISAAANWYFMAASTFLITAIGTYVTNKIVEPRLGKYEGEMTSLEELTPVEKKGLKYAGVSIVVFLLVIASTILPENGILRSPTGGIMVSPFMDGLIVIMALSFAVPGIVYGKIVGTIKNDTDVAEMMAKQMRIMASYIAMTFTAAQFIAWFNYTNLATVLAVNGATFLKSTGFVGAPLFISFVVVSAFINLFMGSASAKWAILAPVFVPMFMTLGYTPEFTQLAYRIGDSTTNIISPLMTYFAMIVAFAQGYKKDMKIGTLISMMVPYSIAFLIGWTILLIIWMVFKLPIGPGIGMFM